MATPLSPSMSASRTDSMRRSPAMRKKHSSFSSIAVGDEIDTAEIQLTDPCALAPNASTEPLRQSPVVAQPIPTAPRVGPGNFEKLRVLGAGSTGRVYLVRTVELGPEAYYAMKVVKKSELVKRNRVQRVLTERQILSVADHPFVVTLHYCFQTAHYFYLVMQYCAGGELFSFLRSQENHRFREAHAKFYAAEVLIALEYLHLIGIIYRDLKPENILVHESGHVMLSDFDLAHEVQPAAQPLVGRTSTTSKKREPHVPLSPTISTTDPNLWFRMRERHLTNRHIVAVVASPTSKSARAAASGPAQRKRRFSCPCVSVPPLEGYPHMDTESHMNLGEKRTSFVGTHEYVAPEIISEEGYVGSVDWWAFGILLYEMIFGVTPFRGATQLQTLENILDISEEIEFPPDVPVSAACRDLIEKLLAKNIDKRLKDPLLIKSHPFFKDLVWPLIRHQQPPMIPTMVHSLEERQYTQVELTEFDDEVPFHRAIGSPRRRSRRLSLSSMSSSCSTAQLASIAQLSYDGPPSIRGDSVDDASNEHAAEDSPVRAAILPAYLAQAWDQSPSGVATQRKDDSPEEKPLIRVPSLPPSPSSRAIGKTSKHGSPKRKTSGAQLPSPHAADEAAIAANTTGGVVHDFEFVSNQRQNYWPSGDSHRSLTAKLAQLDLAALALGPEEGDDDEDRELEEAEKDKDDEQKHENAEGEDAPFAATRQSPSLQPPLAIE